MAPRPTPFSFVGAGSEPPPERDPLGEPTTETPVADAPTPPAQVPIPPAPQSMAPQPLPPQQLAPQSPSALTAALEPASVRSAVDEPAITSRSVYFVALLGSLIWIIALGLSVWGNWATFEHLSLIAIGFLALLAIAPMGLIWAGAYVVAQARTLALEARRAKRLTDALIGPTALAAAQTGAVVEAMRGQIATAEAVANQARDHLTALRVALATETERLAEATAQASRTTIGLVETLSRERGELNTLALTMDARAAAVTDAINRQVHMVAEASDLAETHLREAEASLASRAADLAAAAGEAVDVSRIAAEDLGRQVIRLETASVGVGDQMRALEDGLTEQRAALVTVAHALRADQEEFTSLAETRTAQLSEFLGRAREEVSELNEATTVGAAALGDLINSAGGKFRELAEAAGVERDAFAQAAEGTLKGLSEAGAREREHLETAMRSTIDALSHAAVEAREAADVHAEAARARVDLLNEAAFAAGQKADQVFESRLDEAKALIEHSAQMVEDAGRQAAQRLETQVEAARQALGGLNEMMDSVAARAARLPAETGAKAGEIRAAVEEGLDSLLASARRAAEETQAIDAAFQERVKRNYEMLSEAVQLMGVVASGGQGASMLQRPSPAERARSRIAAAQPTTRPLPAPTEPSTASLAPPATPPNPAVQPATPQPAPPPAIPDVDPAADAQSGDAALRGRVRLTPAATDDEFKTAFSAASGQAPPQAPDDSAWTWKELLTTLDGDGAPIDPSAPPRPPAPVDAARVGEDLFRDIEAMGIDPGALLPRGRIEEIAAAVQAGDGVGAREVVRALAPAAIRRIARRLISDGAFRGRVQSLTAHFSGQLAEAVRRDRGGFEAAALLNTNPGRAYLLLEAAS